MLNRLPRYPGTFAELLADLSLHPRDYPRVARSLGVSERTIKRWATGKAPLTARLSLWWLSREGYSEWDCEMERRAYYPVAMARAVIDEARHASRMPSTVHAPAQRQDQHEAQHGRDT